MSRFTKRMLVIIIVLFSITAGVSVLGGLWGPSVQPDRAWESLRARFPVPTPRQIEELGLAGEQHSTRTLWQWDGRQLRRYYELTVEVQFHVTPAYVQSYGGLVDARTGEVVRVWRTLPAAGEEQEPTDVQDLWK